MDGIRSALIVALLSGLLFGCGSKPEESKGPPRASAPPIAPPVPVVEPKFDLKKTLPAPPTMFETKSIEKGVETKSFETKSIGSKRIVAQGSSEAPKTAAPPTAAPTATKKSEPAKTDELFTTVRVFYGTDRKPGGDVALEAVRNRNPFVWALMFGAAAAVCGSVSLWRPSLTTQLLFAGTFGAALTLAGYGWLYHAPRSGVDQPMEGVLYSNERGELQYGACDVTIPVSHKPGQFETPLVYTLQVKSDPAKHILLQNVAKYPADRFFAEVYSRVQQANTKDVFVFFHGFNVSFEEAARRTAQLSFDLKFGGVPMFFSWPSRGELLDYHVDENNAEWAMPDVKQFLTEVAQYTGADNIHLIAHSMGNRALTNGIVALASDTAKLRFRNIILTAPDIDVGVFNRVVYPAVINLADRVTLYASSRDWALKESQRRHFYPRIGDSGAGMLILPRVDTIDVSAVDTGFLGHSYYGDSDSVITDMTQLINESRPPENRQNLQLKLRGEERYWLYGVQ